MSPDERSSTPREGRFGPSLCLYFDASVLYGPDNGTPTSAAIGFLVESGVTTHVERSIPVDAFVSSSHLEYRALLEAVRAVDHIPVVTYRAVRRGQNPAHELARAGHR